MNLFEQFSSLPRNSSVKFPRKIGYPISSDLPTLLYPILSDFREPTYPPNHRISYVDGPKGFLLDFSFWKDNVVHHLLLKFGHSDDGKTNLFPAKTFFVLW